MQGDCAEGNGTYVADRTDFGDGEGTSCTWQKSETFGHNVAVTLSPGGGMSITYNRDPGFGGGETTFSTNLGGNDIDCGTISNRAAYADGGSCPIITNGPLGGRTRAIVSAL